MHNLYVYFVLAVFISLTVFMYKILIRRSKKLISKMEESCRDDRQNYKKYTAEVSQIDKEIDILEDSLEETIALYNINKAICKSLDKDKVFSLFKDQLKKYIHITNCKLTQDDERAKLHEGHAVMPINIEGGLNPLFLVCDIKREEDKEKFNIMSEQFLLGFKRAVLYEKIQELSITDTLTGTLSRKYCLERLSDELQRSKRMKLGLSVLMVDIDHFKEINDKFGHLVGDAVLKQVCSVIKQNIRQIDLIGRYGGEEFLIVLTETGKTDVRLAAERIRQAVEADTIKAYDEELKITVSIGSSVFPEHGENTSSLIEKADSALYKAKESGRNRFCIDS